MGGTKTNGVGVEWPSRSQGKIALADDDDTMRRIYDELLQLLGEVGRSRSGCWGPRKQERHATASQPAQGRVRVVSPELVAEEKPLASCFASSFTPAEVSAEFRSITSSLVVPWRSRLWIIRLWKPCDRAVV